MKKLLLMLGISFAFLAHAEDKEKNPFDDSFAPKKLHGILHTNTYLMCKSRAVSFFPSIGCEYVYEKLFTPGILMGIGISKGEPFCQSTDLYVKSKFQKDDKVYFKQGVWCLCLFHKESGQHRVHTCPKASIGVDLDNKAFAELSLVLASTEISKANFGMSSGFRF